MALLIFNGATLGRVPAWLNDDDGAYASAGYQFWRTGEPGIPGYRDVAGFERHVWSFGRVGAAVQGVAMRFAGVSAFTALLPSFLAGIGLVLVTAELGAVLWGAATGRLAALLLAASGKFFLACHGARPDLLLAFCFITALWLAASAPAGEPERRLLLAGLVMGIACDVHLNGFLLAPVPLFFWLLLRAEETRVRWRAAVVFIGAGVLCAFFWLLIHYWSHPAEFRFQAGIDVEGLRVTQLGVLGALKAEIKRYTDWFWAARGHRHMLEGLLVLGGLVWTLKREGRTGRALAGAWGLIFLIGAALMNNPFGWYLIFVWPLFAVWMARALVAFPARRIAQSALALLLAAYLVNLGLWHFKASKEIPQSARLIELRRLIPANVPVLANGALWFAFWDRDYTDDYYLTLRALTAATRPPSEPTGWGAEQRRRGWRYIVAYGYLRRMLDAEVPLSEMLSDPIWGNRKEEVEQARSFALEHCSVIHRIPGWADTILVLRVNDATGD
ncbi:MAG: glycosyltransferase family 39 protein [Blastocatellia bacterium]